MISNYTIPAVLVAIVVFILLSCATHTRKLPMPEQLQALGVLSPEADLERLREGRALAITECACCHRFYWPDEYSASTWRSIIRRMAPLSSLTGNQEENMAEYFISAAAVSARSDPAKEHQ